MLWGISKPPGTSFLRGENIPLEFNQQSSFAMLPPIFFALKERYLAGTGRSRKPREQRPQLRARELQLPFPTTSQRQ